MKLQIGHWELTFRRLHHPKGLTLKSSQIFTTFSWDMARTNLPQPPNHDPNGPHQNTSLCALLARSAHHLSLESKIQTAGAIVENGSEMDQKWIKNGSKMDGSPWHIGIIDDYWWLLGCGDGWSLKIRELKSIWESKQEHMGMGLSLRPRIDWKFVRHFLANLWINAMKKRGFIG